MTRNRHAGPMVGFVFLLCLTAFFPALPSHGAGLVDVPLTPWSHFELYRDWTYTAIERLVTAGIVGPWVLNTKPMSRMEMARVVATAIRKVKEDEAGRFAQRPDLEAVLYELMDEFAPELEAMALRNGHDDFAGQPWLTIQPLSHLQARAFYVKQDVNPENSQGLKLVRPYNGTLGFDSYLQIHDFFSGYIHPEFDVNKNEHTGRIVEGNLKLKFNNLAIRFGRESIWWGPGYHGSMMFSNNATPLDQFRIGTAEPMILPGFLKYLGPTRMELMYARLSGQQVHPNSILGSWRVDFSPLSLLEFGVARTVQMGGDGRPSMSFLDYLAALVISKDDPASKYQTNQLYTIDGTIRLHDVDRLFPLSRDLALYAEMEVDDTCCKNVVWPLKPGYMVGLYLPNLFGRDNSELRVEWTSSTSFTWSHSIWTDGISSNGLPLAHYIGTKGQELYIRGAERILPNLQIGTEFGLAKVGSTELSQLNLPREEHKYLGIDISYKPTPALSLLLGYRYDRIDNKDLVADQQAKNHIVRLEATYSFPAFEKGLIGQQRREDALRPVTPPPAPRAEEPYEIDPDEVVSVNYLKRVFKDTGTMLISPLHWDAWDWLTFVGVGATTGGLMFADKGIRGYVQKHHNDTNDTIASILRPFEEIVPASLVAIMTGVGYAFDEPKLKAAGADALESTLIAVGALSMPMKFFTGRARPDRNLGPTHYDPFTLGSSFPSFTAAEAFAVASTLSEHFPNPVITVLAYGLAAGAAATRIYDDKHWASDVFLGAVIGTVVGKAVVKFNEQRRENSKVSVIPLLDQGIRGAALQVKF